MDGPELALELVAITCSKVRLRVREAPPRHEIVGKSSHVPPVIDLDRGVATCERIAQCAKGTASGSMHRMIGRRCHAAVAGSGQEQVGPERSSRFTLSPKRPVVRDVPRVKPGGNDLVVTYFKDGEFLALDSTAFPSRGPCNRRSDVG